MKKGAARAMMGLCRRKCTSVIISLSAGWKKACRMFLRVPHAGQVGSKEGSRHVHSHHAGHTVIAQARNANIRCYMQGRRNNIQQLVMIKCPLCWMQVSCHQQLCNPVAEACKAPAGLRSARWAKDRNSRSSTPAKSLICARVRMCARAHRYMMSSVSPLGEE